MPPGTFSPVVLADRDSEDRGVDLAGLRVPSPRDAEDEAAFRRDEVVVCRVCHRAYAKYTCPRCHTRYCALACYKSHDARCVESFHGDALGDAMRGLVVDDDEKRKMAALLQKYAPGAEADHPLPRSSRSKSSTDASSESSSSGDEDETNDARGEGEAQSLGRTKREREKKSARCALSRANLEKLSRGEALTLADLTPATMRALERAARAGELSHLLEPHVPWWTRASARDVKLRRDGTSVARPVDDEKEPPSSPTREAEASETLPPPIEDTPLVPLRALLAPSAKNNGPSPALRWHALDAVAAYTLITRAHDGDARADPLAAARDLVAFSPTLAAAAETKKSYAGLGARDASSLAAKKGRPRGLSEDAEDVNTKESLAAGAYECTRLPTSATAALAGVAAATAAAGATRGVAAAAAAAAAGGLTHRDVRDVFRGGRGVVVLALCDARRIVRAAVAELEEEGEDKSANAFPGAGETDGDRSRNKANARFARALSRAERKLFFLACWAAETEPGDGTLEHIASWCERAARKQPGRVQVETRPGGGPGLTSGNERARREIREM